ncbi:LRP5_6 [Mytilus coruscus]|uniref:LRP5_6 n=1 Tax=Mytilus coruscus TaxID=42192 RepID=A0A6J8DBW6_MYTCO|nr:LRP5_6 [Mytilus coruscus]
MEFDVDTRYVTVLVQTGGYNVYALDYDYENRYVYLTRSIYMGDILRFAYPSKTITLHTVVQTDSQPTGIAVDSTNDHIYWIDHGTDKLSRCNLDGSNVTVLSTLSNPFTIRLNVTNRWMYIVEQDVGILKSRFDLSNKWTTINFTSTPVYCMVIDELLPNIVETDEQRLYWINYDGDMESAKVDGFDVKTIISTNRPGLFYYAIGVFGGYIYYANDHQLLKLDKSQGSTPTVLYYDTNRIDSMFLFDLSGM